ncbi:MAG TPA: PIN domain nuclease [Acidobacteriaceae bacterium]|nr:PIN domain nuclease [Acidobacteriaceae bacterium]
MVIVDSSVWIDYLAARANSETMWLREKISPASVGLVDLVLCEVLQGIESASRFERVRGQLMTLRVFDTGGAALAVAAAENYRVLRAKGITVRKTIDCLIATFCIREGHVLLHRDHDYDPFERFLGLRVAHP